MPRNFPLNDNSLRVFLRQKIDESQSIEEVKVLAGELLARDYEQVEKINVLKNVIKELVLLQLD